MTSLICRTLLAFCVGALPFMATAEIPPLSQEQLQKAPLIVTGKVTSVVEKQTSSGDCRVHYDVTIEVKVSDGETSTVRGYYEKWTCTKWKNEIPPTPQPPGHYGIWGIQSIKVGDTVTIYAGRDGSILDPNGIQ
jgi:hypothetical protein